MSAPAPIRSRRRGARARAAGLLALLLLAAGAAPAARAGDPPPEVQALTFDRYYDVEGLGRALRALADAYPRHTRLTSMGPSREGRPLWVLTIFEPVEGLAPGTPPPGRPDFYADGNTHGNEVQAAEVCLFLAKHLLTRDDPWVRALRARVTFHIAPCVNPDSRERYLKTPQNEHSPRRVLRPFDDDRDGRTDEDGPDDLDGDGEILDMRVADPDGDLVTDERDPRRMRPRRPGEPGQWRLLGTEGRDDDGDGRFNEDPEGGVDPNRNWPASWRPEVDQGGAGPFPLSEPETRATAEYLLGLPHLAGVQSFHNAGRMILRPPAAFTDAEVGMPGADKALYDEIGRRGTVLLPTYRYLQIREDLYRVFGGFVDWAYVELGATAFTNELWGGIGREPSVSRRPETDDQAAALEWNDVALHGAGFVRWRPVPHPQLGTVELGGWRRYTTRTNPVDFLHETCARNALFVLEHAATLPRLRVEASRPGADGGVRAVLVNEGLQPTVHAMAQRLRTLPPDRVRLVGVRLAAAVRERVGAPPEVLDVEGDTALLPEGVPGTGRVTLTLHPAAGAPAPREVRLESRVGGEASAPLR